MAEIKINPKEEDGFRIAKETNIGFEVDRRGSLYLVHGGGISEIKLGYDGKIITNTRDFSSNQAETKPLPKGTKIEITI